MKQIYLFLIGCLLGFSIAFFILNSEYKAKLDTIKPQVIETIVRDTVVAEKPVYVARKVVDTMLVPVVDTIRCTDTLYLALDREEVMYRDSNYFAVVSGFAPRLDYIETYTKTITETITKRDKVFRKWNFGLTAGVGAVSPFTTFSPQLGYFIGLGVTHTFEF